MYFLKEQILNLFISCLVLTSCSTIALAQGQGNIWYFGNYAGLDFNTSPPTPLLDGQVNTQEGCASISDPSGNLLFYTDGIWVWDKTHTQMPNGFGLLGDPSSAQSGVIIPMPGNDSIYYLFTTPDFNNASSIGFRYTIVNMNLNGGLGDVVPASKNTLLFSPSSEKLAASFHCNNKDIWVVGRSNQDFYSYLITETGISLTPVITSGITNSSYPYYFGMKSSPNGKKIVANYAESNVSELYDFDISTGQLSNPILLTHTSSDYGAEFSPDGTKLYISLFITKEIYQYDLTAPDINASGVFIGTVGGTYVGMPQLAPDGKIYISEYQSGTVAIIHSPNTLGTACNLQPGALNLGGRIATFGFPTMISNFFAEPVKVLTADTVCFSSPANFSLSGVMDEDSIRWNFGDPSTGSLNSDTGLTVSHTFSTDGNFNILSIVYYPCRTDTLYDTVYVASLPTAAFSSTVACGSSNPIVFQDSSSVSSGNITSWIWNFGDGSPLHNQQQVNGGHTYPDTGTYYVMLVVTNNANCSDSLLQPVTVYPNPVTNFGSSSYCKGASTLFSDSSTYTYGSINAWSWNFGDGSPLYNQQQIAGGHVYPDTGTYYVKLVVTSNTGCSDSVSKPVIIYPNPVANFSASNVCFGESIDFTDVSTVTIPNTITSWEWIFGDSSAINTLQHPSYIYSNFGNYDVTLIVTTNQSCKDTVINTVIVHPLPEALFTTNNVCLGANAIFTGNSSVPANPTNDIIQQALWNMGDGTTIITQNPTYLYADTGSYAVQLIVTTNFGCADSVNISITINPNPVVAFTISDTAGCTPLCISFTDTSTVSNGSNISWQWNLGDGSPVITSQDVSHCYTNAGSVPASFSPTLTVTSDSGCVSTLTKTNYILAYSLPVADFTITPQTTTLATPAITITNLSSGATTYNWDFGNSDTSSLFNPQPHNYSAAGTYLITLIVTSTFGCMDTAYQTAIIEYSCELSVPNAFSPNNDGHNDTFILHGWDKCVSEFSIIIFNRWGEKVFESNSPSKSWDGKYKAGTNAIGNEREINSNVFVYYINATLLSGETITKKGNITVIR